MTEKAPKDIVLDFSAVEPFLPLDDKRNYLLQVSAMTPGVSKSGGQKIDVEYTVLAPDKVMSVDGDGNDKEVTEGSEAIPVLLAAASGLTVSS